MAFIRQRHKSDCGIAAIAMLCDVTYEEVDRVILWRKHGYLYGTDTRMLCMAAERLGYESRGTKTNQLKRIKQPPGASLEPGKRYHEAPSTADMWRDIPNNSLVKVPRPDESMWHWVAWRKGKIYDPARGVFNPERTGLRPSAYMHFVPEGTEDCPDCGTPTEAQQSGIKCPKCDWASCL